MQRTETPLTPRRRLALLAFLVAAPVMIPLGWVLPGLLPWGACLGLAWREGGAFRRRMGVLLAAVLLLSLVDIGTDLSNRNFLLLGGAFLAVVLGPWLALRRSDPGVIRYRWIPLRFRRRDIAYVLLSVPLAWGVIRLYFTLNPWMPTQWTLPPETDPEQVWRLFTGINLVGIWDELFFVNTVFAVFRSLFPYRWANAGQAVVYTSVLFDMAFAGWGLLFVPVFAWTQGAMFEGSEGLIHVVLVHLIVDFFLFTAIVHDYYPGFSLLGWH